VNKHLIGYYFGILSVGIICATAPPQFSMGYLVGVCIYQAIKGRKLETNKLQSIEQKLLDKSQSMLWLVSRKGTDCGHCSVILQLVTSDGKIDFTSFNHYPRSGFSASKGASMLENINKYRFDSYKYVALPISVDQIDRLLTNFQKSSKKFCIGGLSEMIPIPWNGDFVFGNCASFSAKLFNSTMGTRYIGSDPLILGMQLENKIF
jgi:hypothetical protein